MYRRDVSEWQGFKWLLPIIALASLAIGIFVFTDDERDLTMEEQLATQGGGDGYSNVHASSVDYGHGDTEL